MQQDIIASSELHSTFPRYYNTNSNSSRQNTLSLMIPNSKYSSTESEGSSDEQSGSNVGDLGKPPTSGFSTSCSSTGSKRKRKKKRKRRYTGRSSLDINLKSGSRSDMNEHQTTFFAENKISLTVLNSVFDLKHAIGRHRGISGSNIPAIDAALFAMFYLTDAFDDVILNGSRIKTFLDPKISTRRTNVMSVLRKEIIYSLRMNYYCPASKIAKLAKLIEDNFPTDIIQDIAGFLELLFGHILAIPPFLKFANGSTGYIQQLLVQPQFQRNYKPVLTVQHILSSNSSSYFRKERINFQTVPYPTLLLEMNRNQASPGYLSSNNWDNYRSSEVVIPNLEIVITDLLYKTNDSFRGSCDSIASSVMTSASFTSERSSFSQAYKGDIQQESRIVKGLKSAWNVMFQYLEDFTSSSHFTPPETSLLTNFSNDSHPNVEYERIRRVSCYKTGEIDDLTSSMSTSYTKSYLESSSFSSHLEVRMELIAVVCLSITSKSSFSSKTFSGYSVYCKAGKGPSVKSLGESFYAPWVLYECRSGVIPQVTLIENFGKWISSLERNKENFNLYDVPVEIRRVLEDSKLLIYRRLESE